MKQFQAVFLFGPTASGKSTIAIELAKKLNGVIINADSMQVYKGVQTVTAAPTAKQRKQAYHTLYNFVDPHETFDVEKWQTLATKEIHFTAQQGQLPILCGGTGLYATALLKGLAQIPDPDPNVRAQVRKERASVSYQTFYDTLCLEDPIMAKRIKPRDTQRIARALEIVRTTKKSLAHFQEQESKTAKKSVPVRLIKVVPDRLTLYKNIDARFDHIIKQGGLEEIKALKDRNIPNNAPILKAIGVRELLWYTEGTMSLKDAVTKAKTSTRRYAKRQYTYMKHQLATDFTVEDRDDVCTLLSTLKNKV